MPAQPGSPRVERQILPLRRVVGAPTILPGGATGRPGTAYSHSRVAPTVPRAAVRRYEDARAQRLGLSGHRSPDSEVERRGGPHILSPSPPGSRYRGRVLIGFVGAGLMGSGHGAQPGRGGPRGAAATRARRSGRASLPVTVATSFAEAVDGADLACSCVTDSPDVVEVVDGRCCAPATPAPVLVEMSTIAPAVARELADACASRGRRVPRLPGQRRPDRGRGGHAGRDGGGDAGGPRAWPRRPSTRWATPPARTHCGAVGLGLVAKLVNNMLVATIAASTAEALGAGQRAGLDPALAREVVMRSSGDSWQLRNLFPRVLAGDHAPGLHGPEPAEGPRPRPRTSTTHHRSSRRWPRLFSNACRPSSTTAPWPACSWTCPPREP